MSETNSGMFVVVYVNEGMDQGYVYECRELASDEIMDAHAFASRVASTYDRDLAPASGYIPNCCGDLRVEFMDYQPEIDASGRYVGKVRIWSGESFYFGEGC